LRLRGALLRFIVLPKLAVKPEGMPGMPSFTS